MKRVCPTCSRKLIYSTKYHRDYHERNNKKCRNCCRSCIKEKYPHKDDGLWKRECPRCKEILRYKRHSHKNYLEKINALCKSCSKLGKRNPFSDPKKFTEEHRKKISCSGKGRKITENQRQALIISNKNRVFTKEIRKNMRLSRIKYLESCCNTQIHPVYNKQACKFIENLNENRRWRLQHAENGGEYFVKELGYWVDGYDKRKNIVFEYDEKNHKYKKEKDKKRMNEIINHLGCRFFRYDEMSKKLKEYFL